MEIIFLLKNIDKKILAAKTKHLGNQTVCKFFKVTLTLLF